MSRQPSDQVIGSVHRSFRFGPVGPLKNAFWSSPHRPSNSIHGKRSRGGGWVGRDRRERRAQLAMRASRVVAADACLRGATEIERVGELVGVRTDARVDNGVRLVDDLELVVVPARPLGPLVRAVADRDGLLVESVPRIVGVEDELDHLPVALVQVVEVVERVEEPVLERDLARVTRFRRNMRVHGRLAPFGEATGPALVAAAWIERVAREVEVVLESVPEVLRPRPDLHQVERVPRPAQRDGRLVVEK